MELINKEMVLLLAMNPFKEFDLEFAGSIENPCVFPLIKVKHTNPQFERKIHAFSNESCIDFGILIEGPARFTSPLPSQVKFIILEPESDVSAIKSTKCIYQINSLKQAEEAVERNAYGIVIKGNESAGKVGEETSFVLFQNIIKRVKIPVWVRGGIGIHSSAALIGLGAKGVLLDYQLCCFPQMSMDKHTKSLIGRLEGTDTKVMHSYRFYEAPGGDEPVNGMTAQEFILKFDHLIEKKKIWPLPQDINLANYYFNKYKELNAFISALLNSIHGHISQAQNYKPLSSGNALCQELGIKYPFIQGPMTRVSDSPLFANEIAKEGALPFVALSLLQGDSLKNLLKETQKRVHGKKWGVGVLGFAPKEIWEEQCQLIEEIKPDTVIIAGGRSSQTKYFEQKGIKAYLHVPTDSLLDIYLNEGVKRFVFEGRECGGHVGPLTSLVLWEKQIERLLKVEDAEDISVLFAGGIANSLSLAIVSIMCAPLVAKGIKVGVVLGSAYLFTKEAVETGAILQQFQDMLLKAHKTVLVESGSGYVTRCLDTPFVDFFNKQRHELLSAGQDRLEVKQYLEKLNVGRLRIASKGMDRKEDKLVKLSQQEQLNEGMYMIGQLTSLFREATTIHELHSELQQGCDKLINDMAPSTKMVTSHKPLDIAIVGMSCIFPGANDLDEYWRNIITGKNCITEVPDERWDKEFFYDPNATDGAKTPSKLGGFIPTIKFNPLEFGIIPNSLNSIDPAQLLSLHVASKALEDAGYHEREFDRENTSVIFGVDGGGSQLSTMYDFKNLYAQFFDHMPESLKEQLPKTTEDSFPGILANVISGRIANRLDLGGCNFTVDAACASSLASLDVACSQLATGRSNMVLAGGVDLHNNINHYLMFASSQILSKKGKYSVFDEGSDGIILGEGVAVVVLKRLDDAMKDEDKIYAVIKGLGSSSDGKSSGLTAPDKKGQYRAFTRAYHQAGIMPTEIEIIEAHGTGTTVGDRIELSSMTDFFYENGTIKNQIHLSSVKPQIGHTKCAAGMAGLIKTALCVYHSILPPLISLIHPNKFYKQALSPFSFNHQTSVWMSDKRKAGISSFGFGGTNFHTVIENHHESQPDRSVLKSWPSELYVFRGDDFKEACAMMKNVQLLLATNQDIKPKNIAYSLFKESKKIQVAIVADDIEDLQRKISKALNVESADSIYYLKPLVGEIAFLFSGQGSQRLNMTKDLFVNFPFLRNYLRLKPGVEKIVFPSTVFDKTSKKEQEENLKDTRNAQPILGIFDYAIASFLKEMGICPNTLAGHSYGEIPALCFANVFHEESLVSLSEDRALSITQSIQSDPGIMLAVSCEEGQLIEIIKDHNKVYLANHNAPNQLVTSGSTPEMEEFSLELKKRNIPFKRLQVACAFHSPLLTKSQEYFSKALEKYEFNTMQIPVWSNTSAELYPTDSHSIKQRLSEHLIKPVLFSKEIKEMYQNGVRIFIEVGPGKVLTQLVGHIMDNECLKLNTEQANMNGITCLLNALAQYMASGREIHYERLFEDRNVTLLNLYAPQSYAHSPSLWNINGYRAYPLKGKMPVIRKIKSADVKNKETFESPINRADNLSEKIVNEYLMNIRTLVQSQHEMVMSYLGSKQTIQKQNNNLPTDDGSVNDNLFSITDESVTKNNKDSENNVTTKQMRSFDSMKDALLKMVSEKTGYPEEMLGLDMDLEADLSIDSIKRVDLISHLKEYFSKSFDVERTNFERTEHLSAIRTLRELAEWFYGNTTKLKESKMSSSTSRLANTAQVETPTDSLNMKSKLLKTISEKTGYPEEMLGMDMDLEADLSIDSIKRMEIIDNLKSYFKPLQNNNGTEGDVVERLATIKTLNGLAEWILNPEHDKQNTTIEPRERSCSGKEKISSLALYRKIIHTMTTSIEKEDDALLAGKNFCMMNADNAIAQFVKNYLKQFNAKSHIQSATNDLEKYDGLIFFDLKSCTDESSIGMLFDTVKSLDVNKVKWIYVVSDYKSDISTNQDIKSLDRVQGYAGFIKSIDKECKAKCKIIHIESDMSNDKMATIVADELLSRDEETEIFYKEDIRQTTTFIDRDLVKKDQLLKLQNDSVVLVFGGAQGITSEIIIEMAKEFPCRYILVGRTLMPTHETDHAYSHILNMDSLRKKLLAEEKFNSPKELEARVKKLFKQNQIAHTLNEVKTTGAHVEYQSIDLTDEKSLKVLFKEIYCTHNRIDGIIHAAGYLSDKLCVDKTDVMFQQVYHTKVNPLKTLLESMKPDLKFLMLFSSISSVMGNKGQVDYSAANSVMDDYAFEIQRRFNIRTIAINWGPWMGKGMVSKELENDFLKRGLASIPIKEGVKAFMGELKFGQENQVVIMAPIMKTIDG